MEHYDTAIKAFAVPERLEMRLYAMPIPDALSVPGAAYPWLSETERKSALAMTSPRRRAQFAAGRLLLREALLRNYGAASLQWRVGAAASGAPHLVAGPAAPVPGISLSHTDGVVLCGIAEGGALGVDVERCVPRRSDWDALAQRVLHPSERARLDGLDAPGRWRGFYRAWTLKEALAKALGAGLALPFHEVAFAADLRLEAVPAGYGIGEKQWNFYAQEAADGIVVAAARSTAAAA